MFASVPMRCTVTALTLISIQHSTTQHTPHTHSTHTPHGTSRSRITNGAVHSSQPRPTVQVSGPSISLLMIWSLPLARYDTHRKQWRSRPHHCHHPHHLNLPADMLGLSSQRRLRVTATYHHHHHHPQRHLLHSRVDREAPPT